MKFIKEEATKANTRMVTMFGQRKGWFSVDETMEHNEGRPSGYYRVELDRGWCDCIKFQVFRMSCSHVTTTCSKARQGPSNLLSIIYKVINLCNMYKNSFSVLAKEDYWPSYQGEIVWHNENM